MKQRSVVPRNKYVAVALLCLAVFQFIAQVGTLAKGTEFITTSLTLDDTYYYLETAWNTKRFGFPTFDGIHPTNGVQLLWFWIVTLIALLVPTKISLLYATLIACFALNSLCYLVIWKLGKLLVRPTLSLYMGSIWALLSFGGQAYSHGLENSLHAFIFWCTVWQVTRFVLCVQETNRFPSPIVLTVFLTMNVWTRLDAAIYSTVLFICCVAFAWRRSSLSVHQGVVHLAPSVLLAAGGLVIQLTAFQIMGGSLLPVSALVKASLANWGTQAIDRFARLGIPRSLPPILGITGIAAFIVLRRIRGLNQSRDNRWLVFWHYMWSWLLVANILYLIVAAGGSVYNWWYLSPSYVFWIITFAVIINDIQKILCEKGITIIPHMITVGVCLAVITTSTVKFFKRLTFESELFKARYNVALWMKKNLEPDAVCASWNAGQLGFFSERRVTNLDGLINSPEFHHQVLQGPISIVDYVQQEGVDYIVDYKYYEYTEYVESLPLVRAFPFEKGEEAIRIWKVHPQVQGDK